MGKQIVNLDRYNQLMKEGKTDLAFKELERQSEILDREIKRINSFEGWFPELSGIPVFWLIVGGIAIFINLIALIL